MKKGLKLLGKILLAAFLALAAAAAGLLLNLTITEYRPAEVESYASWEGTQTLTPGQTLCLLSWNTGYGSLDAQNDFFMDGGSGVLARSQEAVAENLAGMLDTMRQAQADIYLLQEVDMGSKRSFYTLQDDFYLEGLAMEGCTALNYKCEYVPYPLPTLGKVESGLLTASALRTAENSRLSLPVPFSWPLRLCNLKRCLLESRFPIEGQERELVVFNLHLEAYDGDNQGKAAQTKRLMELLQQEREKGNYVVAGGDFNQVFPGADVFPLREGAAWQPAQLDSGALPEGFSFQFDASAPSCRLLDGPYLGRDEETQFYIIDGFIVSDNLQLLGVETLETGFAHSDHQPVTLRLRLGE